MVPGVTQGLIQREIGLQSRVHEPRHLSIAFAEQRSCGSSWNLLVCLHRLRETHRPARGLQCSNEGFNVKDVLRGYRQN